MKLSSKATLLVSLPAFALAAAAFQGCAAPVADSNTEELNDEAPAQAEELLVESDRIKSTLINTSTFLTNGTLACEDRWTIRQLMPHQKPIVPRRQYAASCTAPNGNYRMYLSSTITNDQTFDPATSGNYDGTRGLVLAVEIDSANNVVSQSYRVLAECKDMGGIAVSSDCKVVGALCRRNYNASQSTQQLQETQDMVEAVKSNANLYASLKNTNLDEEWLYEWSSTGAVNPSSAAPQERWVVHKSIGLAWEYGHQDLAYDQAGQTYGLSLKTATTNDAHQREQFMVINRATKAIDQTRTIVGPSCIGHPLFNRLAFNSVGGNYAFTCGTDLGKVSSTNPGGTSGFGGIDFVVPRKTSSSSTVVKFVRTLPSTDPNRIGGGPGALVPLSDGGYLGVIAAPTSETSFSANQDYRVNGPFTAIGVVRYTSAGAVSWTRWVAQSTTKFLAQPQIVRLAANRLLLGYGEMTGKQSASSNALDDALRIPTAYKMMEIDENGAVIANTALTLSSTGWGEQDQMVPLGAGRAGWAYIDAPKATITNNVVTYPSCYSPKIKVSVYHN